MHRHHPHVAGANDVAAVADDKGPLHGVAADAPAVLQGLRVAKGDHAGDAVFDVLRDGLDRAVREGGSLAGIFFLFF